MFKFEGIVLCQITERELTGRIRAHIVYVYTEELNAGSEITDRDPAVRFRDFICASHFENLYLTSFTGCFAIGMARYASELCSSLWDISR
jgi:hypothetical protein